MKKNVNVFIAVLLVAVLCGGVIWLQTADEEKLGWNIHDSYGDTPSYSGGAAYTNATFAGPSAGEGGVMPLSSSSALRARTSYSYSYAGAYSGATPSPIAYSQSPIANSLTASSPSGAGLYTTSSKTFNSYGGGGNGGAAMGGAMRGSSSPNSLIASSPITSISSPIAYSTARRGDMNAAVGDNPAQMVAENPVMAMTNAASAGVGNGFYGGYSAMDYSGSANYGQYTGMFGGGSRMGIRGRQNAGPNTNGGNSYEQWLQWLAKFGFKFGTQGENNTYTFNGEQAYNAFLVWYKAVYGYDYDPNNTLTPPEFTYQQWLSWFTSNNGSHGYVYGDDPWTFQFVPVGDILPLLLIALLYMLFVAIKSKSLKSLLKTERSE